MFRTGRKEFSNDPTVAMGEVSALFHKNIGLIQFETKTLKKSAENDSNKEVDKHHQQQHYKIILQTLNKRQSEQVEFCKTALKTHSEHVKQRQLRVNKYGQQDGLKIGNNSSNISKNSSSYAMFNLTSKTELRRRANGMSDTAEDSGHQSSKTSLSVNHHQQEVLNQQTLYRNDVNSRNAQQVESTIYQMGELFSQMAGLVLEQSQTIARIEDDVEIGLTNTAEAHESMTALYATTKGNRGMIVKIFALLVFFILLFLVWT